MNQLVHDHPPQHLREALPVGRLHHARFARRRRPERGPRDGRRRIPRSTRESTDRRPSRTARDATPARRARTGSSPRRLAAPLPVGTRRPGRSIERECPLPRGWTRSPREPPWGIARARGHRSMRRGSSLRARPRRAQAQRGHEQAQGAEVRVSDPSGKVFPLLPMQSTDIWRTIQNIEYSTGFLANRLIFELVVYSLSNSRHTDL